MRILHLNLEKGWRGGERQTLLTLRGLRAGGHEVALAARAGSPLAGRAAAEGIRVLGCGGPPGLARILLMAGWRYDVIHAQTAQAMSLLAALRPVLRAALVFTRRTAFDAPGAAGRHRWKWARADALVAISSAAAAAPRALGLPVTIIPSAVESDPPDPAGVRDLQTRFGLAGRRVLVTAAALSPEKDPLTLIEALAILRQDHPEVLCLHCGAEGAAADAARARVAELGLADHYRLAGFLPRVTDALALAEAYVSSSRFEALGTSVLDACLAGLPVVATDVGGHREILAPDRGLLTPAGDAAALAQQLAWVLDHPQEARAMGARARTLVAREYAVPTMVARYENLYRSLGTTPG